MIAGPAANTAVLVLSRCCCAYLCLLQEHEESSGLEAEALEQLLGAAAGGAGKGGTTAGTGWAGSRFWKYRSAAAAAARMAAGSSGGGPVKRAAAALSSASKSRCVAAMCTRCWHGGVARRAADLGRMCSVLALLHDQWQHLCCCCYCCCSVLSMPCLQPVTGLLVRPALISLRAPPTCRLRWHLVTPRRPAW